MPRRNGLGPQGMGPMTGRGMGFCGQKQPYYGRGMGRGYGRGFYGSNQQLSKDDLLSEKEMLEQRITAIKKELEQ